MLEISELRTMRCHRPGQDPSGRQAAGAGRGVDCGSGDIRRVRAPLRADDRYIPTSARITSEQQPFVSAMLLRGDPGVNVYQPFPRYVAGEHMAFAGAEKRA